MLFFNVFLKTLGFLIGLLVFIIILNILVYYFDDIEKNQFSFVEGDENSRNIIASINLNGPILNDYNNLLGNNFYDYINPLIVKSYLNELRKLNIKALIIKINSPGGTVSATAELETILKNFKKDTNIKIYFFTKEILASGGYWVATSADMIFASYGSIIGSIGVSGPSWFYYDTPVSLSKGIFGQSIETKNGIKVYNQNAGISKDLFNPYRKPDNDEISHLQKIVDDIYQDFAIKVSNSRKVDISFVKNNIGALIYDSLKAKENYLIDDILDYETLITYIITKHEFNNYKLLENKVKTNLIGNLLSTYSNKHIDEYEGICKKLASSINVVIPLFIKSC